MTTHYITIATGCYDAHLEMLAKVRGVIHRKGRGRAPASTRGAVARRFQMSKVLHSSTETTIYITWRSHDNHMTHTAAWPENHKIHHITC